MKSYLHTNYIIFSGFIYLFITMFLFVGCRSQETSSNKKSSLSSTPAYANIDISLKGHQNDVFLYNPMNNSLYSVKKRKSTYELNVYQVEKGWTNRVATWKTKKNQKLENFSYNTTGMLFACLKTYKKGELLKQDIVRLRGDKSIHSLSLIGLESSMLNFNKKKKKHINEITDLQCCGTALAVTYRYGSAKIYNIAEKQALGASNLIGTSHHNLFYDMNYLTIRKRKNQEVSLQNYDARTGELSHSFPLGGNGQSAFDYFITHYQNELYLLSPNGIYHGTCTELNLVKELNSHDLPLPDDPDIFYFQAARDHSLYLGYKNKHQKVSLKKIIPDTA